MAMRTGLCACKRALTHPPPRSLILPLLLPRHRALRTSPTVCNVANPPPRWPDFPKEHPSHQQQRRPDDDDDDKKEKKKKRPLLGRLADSREDIYTLPNLLTLSRILLCPVLAHSILHSNTLLASSILLYCAASDLADGELARRYGMKTVLGTILDPAADKVLMTTMVISLSYKGLLPMPLAVVIIGRDVLLSLSALYFRYASLPPPKTFARFWDFSLPSAEVLPTQISKYNTFLQLVLVGLTTVDPLIPLDLSTPLTALQWTVGLTTIWSGLSYVFSRDAIRYLEP